MGRTVMFIHTASDPTVECTLVPDMALAVAEQFALAGKRVLQSPMNYLQDKRMTLEYSRERLSSASQRLMQAKREQFVRLTAKLDAMSPLKVLTRGYSMAQTEAGEVLRSVRQVELGERVSVLLSDGKLSATVMDKKEEAR